MSGGYARMGAPMGGSHGIDTLSPLRAGVAGGMAVRGGGYGKRHVQRARGCRKRGRGRGFSVNISIRINARGGKHRRI